MFEAYSQFWTGYVNFKDRATRAQYWWPILAHVVVFVGLMMIGAMGESARFMMRHGVSLLSTFAYMGTGIYTFAIILPSVAIMVRRLRDAGFHWALIFLNLIPYIGGFVLLILSFFPTRQNEGETNVEKNS